MTAGAGVLKRPAMGVAADVALRTGTFTHHARGVLWPSHSEPLQAGAQVDIGLLELDLSTCPELLARAEFKLALCAGAAFARLSAEPRGFGGTAHDRWLFGPALDARLALRLARPLYLELLAGARMLFPRHSVVYVSGGSPVTVHRVAPIQGEAGLSLALLF